MADDSVKSILKRVESRTDKLEPALKKLSESLDKIADSFAGGKKESASREDLLQKFKAPFMQGVKPGGVSKDPNTNLLQEIKNTLRKNQEKTFPLFESIEKTLKNIEQKGGMFGGSSDIMDGLGGRGGVKGKDKSKPTAKPTSKIAEGASKAARFAKAIPGVGLAAAAGMGVYDAVTGFSDEGVAENLGIEGRQATFGEKMASAGGSVISGLTFGLMDKKAASRGIAGLFGAGPDEKAAATPSESTAGAIAAANVGKNPSVPISEEDRKKAQDTFQKALRGELPVGGKPGAAAAASVSSPKEEPKKETVAATKEEPKKEAAVKSAPSEKPASKPAKKTDSSSTVSMVEGDENYMALRMAKAALQGLYLDYRDEKQKKTEELINDIDKYPGGIVMEEDDPEYPAELKAIDDKYQKLIEDQKKEVEKLSKAPGVKEAQARQEREDARFEDDDFSSEDSDIFKEDKRTATVTSTETVTGGGSTTTRITEEGKKIHDESLAMSSRHENEMAAMYKDLKDQGKITGRKPGRSQEGSPNAVPELVELRKKQDAERAAFREKYKGVKDTYETVIEPPASSTTTSTTVSDMSQENADMKAEASGGGQPVVITNNNTTSSNQQTVSPVRTSPRPSNNSFERKQMETAVY